MSEEIIIHPKVVVRDKVNQILGYAIKDEDEWLKSIAREIIEQMGEWERFELSYTIGLQDVNRDWFKK